MEEIVKKLMEDGKTISTMESCTGGGLANAITNVPGASLIFHGGSVTYSNEDKIREGVNPETIKKYTVYSSEVAREMAYRISLKEESNYGVGITGQLKRVDPNNIVDEDDVVYISIYNRDNNEYYDYRMQVYGKTREENKQEVINMFIEKFLEIVKKQTK